MSAHRSASAIGALVFGLSAVTGRAGEPAPSRLFVYPANGQSQSQLAQDRYECHDWARRQSGFDPTSPPASVTSAPLSTTRVPVAGNPSAGAMAKGTLAGAVVGGAVGAHNGDALGGAVLGAAVGNIAGGTIEMNGQLRAEREARDRAREIAAQRDAADQALAMRRGDYRRAISACLEGRGYTVR
jgi:hypothetical protein